LKKGWLPYVKYVSGRKTDNEGQYLMLPYGAGRTSAGVDQYQAVTLSTYHRIICYSLFSEKISHKVKSAF